MTQWTEDLKAKAIDLYLKAEPTAENSMEIVNEVAEQLEQSPNGVRMILSKANVYIIKNPAAKKATTASTTASGDKPARVSKEAAHGSLTEAIEAVGGTVDSEIVSKLTGKAAMYFAGLFTNLNKD